MERLISDNGYIKSISEGSETLGSLKTGLNPLESGPKSIDLREFFDAYPRQGDMQLKEMLPNTPS